MTDTPNKPGYQTSEFWITILLCVAGVGLLAYGVIDNNSNGMTTGGALLVAAGVGYPVSRGIAKK